MNKTFYAFLLITGSLTLNGQSITPKAGITLSKSQQSSFSAGFGGNSSSHEVKSVVGFTVGVAYKITMNTTEKSTFSFQPELNFIQKGFNSKSRVRINNGQENYTTTNEDILHINYIEAPILAKWDMGQTTRFHVNFGPSFGFALGGSYKNKSTSDASGSLTSSSVNGKIKFGDEPQGNEEDMYLDNRLDISLQLGGGVTLFNKLILDLRYGLGFSSIHDGSKAKNRVLQLTIGMPLAAR